MGKPKMVTLSARVLKACAKWTHKTRTRYALNFVQVAGDGEHTITYVATDGRRLLRVVDREAWSVGEVLTKPIYISRHQIDRLRVGDDVLANENQMDVKDKNAFGITMYVSNTETFPKWEEVIPPREKTEAFGVDCEFMADAVSAAVDLGQTMLLRLPENGHSPCRIDGRRSPNKCGHGDMTAVIMPVSLE